ncbi:transcriptional regulator [Vibrio sp. JCM 19236]|nr:transcriptional regulator [Vibrio sp. JCM 19236]
MQLMTMKSRNSLLAMWLSTEYQELSLNMKNTDFSLIPYFIVMMDELSISNTAKRFGVSQPAVSKLCVA